MCPLFAPEGSPWTGEKDATCPEKHEDCGWWEGMGSCNACDGCNAAYEQVAKAVEGKPVIQMGPICASKEKVEPKSFDCPRAAECQWQQQAGDDLCPPRKALAAGIDPRICAW